MDKNTEYFFIDGGGVVHTSRVDFSENNLEDCIEKKLLIPAYRNKAGHWLEYAEYEEFDTL